MPTSWGWCSRTAATNSSGVTSVPRSTVSKPAPSSIILTRFLPMSCRSPLTVPMTNLPALGTSVSASSGRRTFMPACMARAAISTSGTNSSPAFKSLPTSSMPAISPPGRISSGIMPWSRACWTSSATSCPRRCTGSMRSFPEYLPCDTPPLGWSSPSPHVCARPAQNRPLPNGARDPRLYQAIIASLSGLSIGRVEGTADRWVKDGYVGPPLSA